MLPPPKSLFGHINVPNVLLMGPGPSNLPPRIMEAGALPLLGHLDADFLKIMDEVREGIKFVFQTKNKITLAVSGTGHSGMECAVCNMLEPGDVALSACNGEWGQRFADMAERHGAQVHKIIKAGGEVFSLLNLEQGLERFRPSVLFVTHGDSSTATLQPLEGIGAACHRYGCLLIVDTVASLGAVPFYMDLWDIDVVYSGSQKVLSCPPGTSPISFSDAAFKKIQARRTKIVSFYFDITLLSKYWSCEGQPRIYHHTGPMSSIYTLREGLAILAEEGLEASWERHARCAKLLYKRLEEMGLKLFVKNPVVRLPTVTAVEVPSGLDWKKVTSYSMEKYKVQIAGGLGPTAGKVWRIGLMGYNATPENVERVLQVLNDSIQLSGAKTTAKM